MDYELYIQGAIKRREKKQKMIQERYLQAWETAKRAASILKQQYAAKEVIAFGSLLHKEIFSLTSDIDLAVSGIPPDKFFSVFYHLAFLEDIKIEMIDIEECKDYIKEAIKKEGIKL